MFKLLFVAPFVYHPVSTNDVQLTDFSSLHVLVHFF